MTLYQIKTNIREKEIPLPCSEELKSILRNQMVLEIFLKTAFTLRIRECSFGEAVSYPIVLSVDVGEGQVLN